jgi:uncharacterized protein
MAQKATCPKCKRQFDPDESKSMPFCCDRCRLIDLGAWLEESYGMPYEPDESPRIFDPNKDDTDSSDE